MYSSKQTAKTFYIAGAWMRLAWCAPWNNATRLWPSLNPLCLSLTSHLATAQRDRAARCILADMGEGRRAIKKKIKKPSADVIHSRCPLKRRHCYERQLRGDCQKEGWKVPPVQSPRCVKVIPPLSGAASVSKLVSLYLSALSVMTRAQHNAM